LFHHLHCACAINQHRYCFLKKRTIILLPIPLDLQPYFVQSILLHQPPWLQLVVWMTQIHNNNSCLIQIQLLLHYGFPIWMFCIGYICCANQIHIFWFQYQFMSIFSPINIFCNSNCFLHIFFSCIIVFSWKFDQRKTNFRICALGQNYKHQHCTLRHVILLIFQ
jgi:hypothetical protein